MRTNDVTTKIGTHQMITIRRSGAVLTESTVELVPLGVENLLTGTVVNTDVCWLLLAKFETLDGYVSDED